MQNTLHHVGVVCDSDADSPCYVPAETDLQSVGWRVLLIEMEFVFTPWGFNVGLTLVCWIHFRRQ